ncbi:MAG: ABC transporter ATP-binding protein [Candidatus Heimdallarchaeota archaeon]
MAIVEVRELRKIFEDKEYDIVVHALRGIDLSVTQGELVGIFGPSGAGKTTLLSIIGGLLDPTSGTVLVDEVDITELTKKQLVTFRRETVGYLWQLPEDNLISGISVLKNVMLPLQISNKSRQEQITIANELLERVELSHRKKHRPNQISGGEAQRAAIAVALANKPKILLGDQITGELDTETSSVILQYIRNLKDELGTTMIIATHKKQFIQSTDHSYELIDGRIKTYDEGDE